MICTRVLTVFLMLALTERTWYHRLADVQKGQPSHPPNPAVISPSRSESAKAAASPKDAPCPKQGRSE